MGKWYKIDTAGKIFPAIANSSNSSTFRVSMILTEPVNPEILQKATDIVIRRFPTLAVKLRRGVFWSFLGENPNKLHVKEESQYPCYPINAFLNNGYLLRVLYFNSRISVEVFHSLTDGTGAIELLKTLVFQYLLLEGKKIEHESLILLPEETPSANEVEDSYDKYYKPVVIKQNNDLAAYHIKGTAYRPTGNNIIHGVISANDLNQIAKQRGVTITEYLTSVLVYSIYNSSRNLSNFNRPVIVAIPVNLRKIFPSVTLRNFFTVVNIGMNITDKTTFEDILKQVSYDLRLKTRKENLYISLAKKIKYDKMIVARFVPAFIKSLAMRYGYEFYNEKVKTTTLSNLGLVVLPDSMKKYIERVDSIIYPTKKSPVNCCVATVNNKLTITFSRTIVEADIIKNFFSFLANETKLKIDIYSNNWGKTNEQM